jgi:hypothetical protein
MIPVAVPSIQGDITSRRSENLLGLEINLETREAFELLIQYNPETVHWNGLKPMDGTDIGIETENDLIQIALKEDLHVFLFFIQKGDAAAEFNMELMQAKKSVWKGRTGSFQPEKE